MPASSKIIPFQSVAERHNGKAENSPGIDSIPKKPPQSVSELRESVGALFLHHECSVRNIGRTYGLTDVEVSELLRTEAKGLIQKAYHRGLRHGQLSMTPPNPPAPATRKVA